MLETMKRNWWTFVARGVFAILFGVVALALPQLTLIVLVWTFAAYALIDGLFQVIYSLTRHEEYKRWWLALLEGVLGILFGVFTFIWPAITGLALFMMIVGWALVTGILEIAAAIELRKLLDHEWMLAFSGILSILLGIGMLVWPGASAVALAWMIGFYALAFGITLIALGFRLKRGDTSFENAAI
ncbi:MAG: HdeD family acid-resistance protein [Anaerolineales bacterium]|jgi:uncharacterized membrane protein HdeD (DUF308 family)